MLIKASDLGSVQPRSFGHNLIIFAKLSTNVLLREQSTEWENCAPLTTSQFFFRSCTSDTRLSPGKQPSTPCCWRAGSLPCGARHFWTGSSCSWFCHGKQQMFLKKCSKKFKRKKNEILTVWDWSPVCQRASRVPGVKWK